MQEFKFSMIQAELEDQESFLDIGSYDEHADAYWYKEHPIIAHRVTGSFHWQVKINRVFVTDTDKQKFASYSWIPKQILALTDTGTSLLYMPT